MSIVIAGYYGFGNAGDELILLSLIQHFRFQDPDVSITVLSRSPHLTSSAFDVHAVNRWFPWKWFLPLMHAKRFILGGGGLLQETSGPYNHFYYLTLLVIAKFFGCQTEVHAIGVDPVHGMFNRFWTKFALNHWGDVISVRDEESRNALVDAGVQMTIAVQPDPVYELRIDSARQPSERVALALSSSAFGSARTGDIARLCTRIAAELHAPVDLLALFPAEDEALTRAIARSTRAVHQVRVAQNPLDILSWVKQYHLVVASRFHALVLAAKYKIPFVGLGAEKKVASFCRTHQMPYANTRLIWNEDQLLASIAALYQSNGKSVILASRTD